MSERFDQKFRFPDRSLTGGSSEKKLLNGIITEKPTIAQKVDTESEKNRREISATVEAPPSIESRGRFGLEPTKPFEDTRATGHEKTQKVISERIDDPEIRKALIGALLYLDDTQVKKRPKKSNSKYTASSGADGCRSTFEVHLPFSKDVTYVPFPGLKLKNREGEWANYIYFAKGEVRYPIGLQDSNAFVPAFVTYPLFLFDERPLPQKQRFVTEMQRMAIENARTYKLGDGYSIYPKLPGVSSEYDRTGPLNIPSRLSGIMTRLAVKQPFKYFFSKLFRELDPFVIHWGELCLDPEINPYGSDSIVNPVADTDDSSVIIANQKLFSRNYDPDSSDAYYSNPDNFAVDAGVLDNLAKYRDIGRDEHCGWEDWNRQAGNTGAFLTFLKDEHRPVFSEPENGLIVTEKNLVDEIVNSNAVFSLALNGKKSNEGYMAACKLITDAVDSKQWKNGAIFYNQRMIFPYCSSRAFRDGGADEPIMREAMKKLLKDVLEDQVEWTSANPDKKGAFPGGHDTTTALSTALGVTFLLNVGKEIAEEAGLAEQYDTSLKAGIDHLLKTAVNHKIKNGETFNRNGESSATDRIGIKWQEGMFFVSDSRDKIVQWWSEAYTTAMCLEAIAKYAMAYDEGGVSIREGRRICIDEYALDAKGGDTAFKFHVS